MKEKKSQIV